MRKPSRARIKRNARPIVAVNFAVTFDGKISTRERTRADFSSQSDKRRLLELRSEADAVLVAAGTLAADSMTIGLPSRELRERRRHRGQPPYPLRVIVTNSGRLDPGLPVFRKRFSPLLIFSTHRMPHRVREALPPHVILHLSDSQVDLRSMMRTLRLDYGVRRLICEGGGALVHSLAEAQIIDEINLTLCPRVFGGRRAITITGEPRDYLAESLQCKLDSVRVTGGECFLRYRVIL